MDEQKKKKNTSRLPPPGKDLASQYPEIAAEWDYELNGDILPSHMFVQSDKKVWWKCKNCGQRWNATVGSRTRGAGCPYDAGKLPILGMTDLSTLRPDLVEEWDYERNGSLAPSMFCQFSHKKIWWKCKNCGQSWQATIINRAHGTGCPYDAGKLPIPGKTDLATLYPNLEKTWDYERNGNLTPEMVTISSHKKVWWKCKDCGQSWQAIIKSRVRGNGCPYCARKLAIPGKTDLATLRPDLTEEWDYELNGNLTPEIVTANSVRKVWWRCRKCSQFWKATIFQRTHGTGCPYDAGRLPIPGKTDLVTLCPDLAKEWHHERNGNLTPEMVTASSRKKVWWSCKNCKQSWAAVINSRTHGNGCPYCAGKVPIPGKTDLATLRPDLAEEWHYERNDDLTPEMVTVSSHKKVWWKCKSCGQEWQATIGNRNHKSGCPYDAGRLPVLGKTDLATLRPDLAEEWDYERNINLTPGTVSAFSDKKAWWRCSVCGRNWKARINDRSRGSACLHNIKNKIVDNSPSGEI